MFGKRPDVDPAKVAEAEAALAAAQSQKEATDTALREAQSAARVNDAAVERAQRQLRTARGEKPQRQRGVGGDRDYSER